MVMSFEVYVLKVLEMILAGQFGSLKSGKGERFGYEGPARVRMLVSIFFLFNRNIFNNRSKESQKCMAATIYERFNCR